MLTTDLAIPVRETLSFLRFSVAQGRESQRSFLRRPLTCRRACLVGSSFRKYEELNRAAAESHLGTRIVFRLGPLLT